MGIMRALSLTTLLALLLSTATAAAMEAGEGEEEMEGRHMSFHVQGSLKPQRQKQQQCKGAGMRAPLGVDPDEGGFSRSDHARIKRAEKLHCLTAAQWRAAKAKFDLTDGGTAMTLWRSITQPVHQKSLCHDTPHHQHTPRLQLSRPDPASIRINPRPIVMLASNHSSSFDDTHDSQRFAHAHPDSRTCAVDPFALDAGACLQKRSRGSGSAIEAAAATGLDKQRGTAVPAGAGAGAEGVVCLPSFLIIGVMKGGTAEVQNWLGKHPLLRRWGGPWISGAGEAHFFDAIDSDEHLRQSWLPDYLYAGLRLNHTNDATSVYTFEKSPSYFFMHRERIERLERVLPSVKLILLLRSPVARAYSHFQHNCAKRRLWKVANRTHVPTRLRGRVVSVPSSIRGPTQRRRDLAAHFLQGAFHTTTIDPTDLQLLKYPCLPEHFDVFLKMRHDGSYNSTADIRMGPGNGMVLRRGLYAGALRKWLRVFDRSQLLVLVSEDLQTNMVAAMTRIESFLGLPHADYEAHVKRNERGYAVLDTLQSKSRKVAYAPMLRTSRCALAHFFEEDTRAVLFLVRSQQSSSILRHWAVNRLSAECA